MSGYDDGFLDGFAAGLARIAADLDRITVEARSAWWSANVKAKREPVRLRILQELHRRAQCGEPPPRQKELVAMLGHNSRGSVTRAIQRLRDAGLVDPFALIPATRQERRP